MDDGRVADAIKDAGRMMLLWSLAGVPLAKEEWSGKSRTKGEAVEGESRRR